MSINMPQQNVLIIYDKKAKRSIKMCLNVSFYDTNKAPKGKSNEYKYALLLFGFHYKHARDTCLVVDKLHQFQMIYQPV